MKKTHERDMSYEMDLFLRMQKAEVNGEPLTSLLLKDDTPFFQRFSQTVLWSDIRRFSENKNYDTYLKREKKLRKHHLKAFLIFPFTWAVSFLAALTLILGRQRVLLFSIDKTSDKKTKSDFRIHRVYSTLKMNNVRFVECFHTSIDRNLIINFLKRKRFSIYLESVDGLWYVYRFFEGFLKKAPTYNISNIDGTEDEIQFMKTTIKKYLGAQGMFLFRTKILYGILRFSNIKAVVGIDDVRHYQELMEASRKLKIKTIVVQHGHFTKYHVGWLGVEHYKGVRFQKADKMFVWSEYWKNELLRLGSIYSEDEIIIAGYPNQNKESAFIKDEQNGFINILIPHERDAPAEEVSEYIKELAKCKNVRVFLKLRPDQTIKEQLQDYPEEIEAIVTPVTDLDSTPKPHVVMGIYSTFLYEMALLNIPIYRMNTSMDYGEGIVINGIAEEVSLENVCEMLRSENIPSREMVAKRIEDLSSNKDFHEVLLGELRAGGVV